MVTSDFRPEVEIWPFRACAMHPAIIIGTVRSLWTWLWGRYHVPQNAFQVFNIKSVVTDNDPIKQVKLVRSIWAHCHYTALMTLSWNDAMTRGFCVCLSVRIKMNLRPCNGRCGLLLRSVVSHFKNGRNILICGRFFTLMSPIFHVLRNF